MKVRVAQPTWRTELIQTQNPRFGAHDGLANSPFPSLVFWEFNELRSPKMPRSRSKTSLVGISRATIMYATHPLRRSYAVDTTLEPLPWTSSSDFEWFDIFDSFNPFNALSFDSFNCPSVFL